MKQNERLKQALLEGTEKFEKLGIPYIITGGTLLGIYKDGDMLLHDNDIDIDVLEEDLGDRDELMKKLQDAFGNVVFHNNYYTMQINVDGQEIPFDIFIVFHKGNKRFRWFNKLANSEYESPCLVWPEKFYYKDEWQEIEFADRKFPVPPNVEKYLEIFFGKDWRQPKANWSWPGSAANCLEYKNIKWE